jgi:hypothetical protein
MIGMRRANLRLSTATLVCVTALCACTDRSGLNLGLGQGGALSATGGAGGATTGSSGVTSTAGTKGGVGGAIATGGTTPTKDAGVPKDGRTCPPICDIFCEYGNVLDSNGCQTCSCNPPPKADAGASKDAVVCPSVCLSLCLYGNVLDSNGCPTCTCNPPPPPDAGADVLRSDSGSVCPALKCKACPFGYLKDASGCETCDCAADPNTPCSSFTSQSACAAADTRCRWLTPGCGTPALSTSGCFDQKLVDCTTTCPAGLTCLQRSVHPCPGGKCALCSEMVGLCL